jgi:transcriptional regulator with XRE-family HTH domain
MDKETENKALIERFIELRKKYGPTQMKFGRLLGLSDGTISTIEAGLRPISEKHIKLICGTLGINEIWFKTGEGLIFTEEIPGQKQLLEAFRQLSPEGRKAAIKLVEALLDSELERAFDEGVRMGIRGLSRAPKTTISSPEAPKEAEKRVNPIHNKKRS